MENLKRIIALVLCIICIMPLAGCGGEGGIDDYVQGKSAGKELEQTAAADDKFTINCNKSHSLNPMTATDTNNIFVCNLVYENMLEVDNGFDVKANIISDWDTSDGGKTWEFTVSKDHVFHDGNRLSASDVAYSIQCAMGSARFGERLSYVNGCNADGKDKVIVTLEKKNMMFPALLTIPVIEYGTGNQTYPGGSGPYQYASDMKSLVAFNKYPSYATLPIDEIFLSTYTDVEETISAFETSLLDAVMNDPSSTTNLGYGSANDVRAFNTTNMHYVGFNMSSRDVGNQVLRFALNYAFNREYLVSSLGGNASAATLPINPSSDLYNDMFARQFGYDLKECKRILEDAEICDYDEDEYLEIKTGENTYIDIDITLVVCTSSSAKVSTARRFASDMDSIGIKVSVNALDWDNYRATINEGKYDMYYAEVRLNSDFDPSKLLMPDASLNYGGISDSNLNSCITAYLESEDYATRKLACESMCEYLVNQAYIIPLCFEKHQFITHRGVVAGINACENNPAYDVKSWRISFKNVDTSLVDKEEKK